MIKAYPTSHRDPHKRRLVRVAHLANTQGYQPTIHYDCPENQIRSLVGRVAGIVPHPTKVGLAKLRLSALSIGRELPSTSADDLYDMPKRYTGNKRRRYEAACDAVCAVGLSPNDASIKMFVKAERFDPGAKVDPDPRAIQFRAAKYCVALAAYLHPIEQHLYLYSGAGRGVPRSRNVAKGLNAVARAELLLSKAAEFRDPVFVVLDASRFDKHVSLELLQLEHLVYLCSNPSIEFRDILKMQLNNKGFSALGLAYKVRGRRMSGDMNTAVGNCVLMLMMMMTCMKTLCINTWDCIDDGDDIVVILESYDARKFDAGVKEEFLSYGMEMKVDRAVSNPYEVVFCQSSIVEYQPGKHKFVRDYRAVMSKALCGVRHWQDPAYRSRVLHAIGTCELVLNLGVPVLQAFALAILRNCGDAREVDLKYAPDGLRARTLRDLKSLGVAETTVRAWPVHRTARDSFACAFGLSDVEQIQLEERLNRWSFDTLTLHEFGEEIEVVDWSYVPSMSEVYSQLAK